MGNLKVTIEHGHGGVPKEAILVLAGALFLFGGGGAVFATVGAAVVTLLTVLAIGVMVFFVAAVVLGIVFRKRIWANLRPRPPVWTQVPGAAPQPVRAEAPKHELHLHFHEAPRPIVTSNGLYQQMPGWDALSGHVVEAEIARD